MAETKSKKSAPKVFDVGKPGKAAPSSTAKPVIITNRPVLQDPMVVNGDSSVTETTDVSVPASPSEIRRRIQIQPLHDLADITDEVAPGAPEVSKEESKASAKSKSKKIDVNKDSSDAIDLDLPASVTGKKDVEEVSAEETSEDKADEKSDKKPAEATEDNEKTDATDTKEADAEAESDEKVADDNKSEAELAAAETSTVLPAGGEPTETASEKTEAPAEESATDTVAAEAPAEPDVATADESPAESSPAEESEMESQDELLPEPALGDEGVPLDPSADPKADAEAKKRAEEEQKIIDSGMYYLPINAVAHRRAIRHTVIGVVLVLLLAALLFLAALDAELITIPGFPAPTDYL